MYVPPPRFRLGELLFTWDPEKAATNIDKHGITFEEAATTWLDPLAIERPDDAHSDHEDRWLRIGASLRGALLVAWSTERQARGRTVIRIIGAREATRKEHRRYDQGEEDD
jgi:uncharacterized DUF497 family protein